MSGRLAGQYAIVGVGDVAFDGATTPTTLPSKLELATQAIEMALADAGLATSDVDCLLSYGADSNDSVHVASALGLSLTNYVDIVGGGSSSETLITMAIGMIEAGSCNTVVIYRCPARLFRRAGRSGPSVDPVYGQRRHAGIRRDQRGPAIRAGVRELHVPDRHHLRAGGACQSRQSRHASANPKALYPKPVSVSDVLDSRMIVRPRPALARLLRRKRRRGGHCGDVARTRPIASPPPRSKFSPHSGASAGRTPSTTTGAN